MRRSLLAPLALPAALAAALLLTSCGMQRNIVQGVDTASGEAASCTDPESDEGTSSGGSGGTYGNDGNGDVRITGQRVGAERPCAAYEITNSHEEPFTYTIDFDFLGASGTPVGQAEKTVASVAPGKTVTETVALNGPSTSRAEAAVDSIRITKVRSVPTAEDPEAQGACPDSGVRVTADDGDAAMGLRVVGLHLENCGSKPYHLDGYPTLRLFDEAHKPLDGVKVLRGGDSIAGGTGADAKPRPLVLKPGERAVSQLVWRNTTEGGMTAVDAPYVQIRPKPGAPATTVTPELDLGTTGKLGVGAWQQDKPDKPEPAARP